MSGIGAVAEGLIDELKRRLPQQRKAQRDNLALPVATMPEVRSTKPDGLGGVSVA